MRVVLISILAALAFCGAGTRPVLGPYTAAGNFSVDLAGTFDTRPDTWGRADAIVKALTFAPPTGYRVRILGIHGDFIAWPTDGANGAAAVQPGRCSGILVSAFNTDDGGSVRADWMADNTLMYAQSATCGPAMRGDFSADLLGVQNARLAEDNRLLWKMASWLNDTDRMIHIEVTFSNLIYQFEPEGM